LMAGRDAGGGSQLKNSSTGKKGAALDQGITSFQATPWASWRYRADSDPSSAATSDLVR
jgi:hypothetical protein